jgi:CPA1 family monovalent cation:H+ antiporter
VEEIGASALIEFLLWLLIAASIIAIITRRYNLPYTIALVLAGLLIDLIHIPITEVFATAGSGPRHLLTPEIIFTLFLPGLLFEAGINIQFAQLRRNLFPILILAIPGILFATLITGYALHWLIGWPLLVALVFGALISATDPISVLALFKTMGISKRLSVIVEGESLFNDGTAVVVFQILLAALLTGQIEIASGFRHFFAVALGGAALGLAMGYVASWLTERVDDPSIEITLTTILAYGSYLVAEHLHVSGVIATVAAGLLVGNYGAEFGMSARTRVAVWSFWEYVAFIINSLVFLLIGIEVHILRLMEAWEAILIAIAAVLTARILSVYALTALSNRLSRRIPLLWQHVLVWGGLHGSVSMALALSLGPQIPHRDTILAMTFGVVAFSIIVQGLTVKPLLSFLGLSSTKENDYDVLRVRQAALAASELELHRLLTENQVSRPMYARLTQELRGGMERIEQDIQHVQAEHPEVVEAEERATRARLVAAEKSAVQKAFNAGLISSNSVETLLADADRRLQGLVENEGDLDDSTGWESDKHR